jgi:TonB family protein
MKRSCNTVFLSLGLALLAAAASGQTPDARWEPIDAGLARLADGDGKGAAATFLKARSADGSGLAELLMDLTDAYVAYAAGPGDSARALEINERLDVANQFFHQRHIPDAVLGDALARIRKRLRQAPAGDSSPDLLRPLLCHLRLLSRDRATDGEPVLEPSGRSSDLGPLKLQRPVFQPAPPIPEAAREARIKGFVVIGLVLDSEGCPSSEKLLKPLSKGLSEQTLATVRWWAYEPARYKNVAVGWKFNLSIKYALF